MKIKVTVRTWHSVRDGSPKGYGNKMFLESVYLPIEVINRIQQWAIEHQVDLLERKYKKQSLGFIESQRQVWLVSLNQLFKQLQREGFKSESELLAIDFLFTQHEDNPELIDLKVTEDYLVGLKKLEAA